MRAGKIEVHNLLTGGFRASDGGRGRWRRLLLPQLLHALDDLFDLAYHRSAFDIERSREPLQLRERFGAIGDLGDVWDGQITPREMLCERFRLLPSMTAISLPCVLMLRYSPAIGRAPRRLSAKASTENSTFSADGDWFLTGASTYGSQDLKGVVPGQKTVSRRRVTNWSEKSRHIPKIRFC